MASKFFESAAAVAAKFPFVNLLVLTWGSFLLIYIIVQILTFALPVVRAASKKPFLCLVNCYTAVTLELYLTETTLTRSAFVATAFWLSGYLLYGFLCAVSRAEKKPSQIAASSVRISDIPPRPLYSNEPARGSAEKMRDAAPANSNVRLGHALAVTEKLLEKNLGRTDRQQLEKLKTTLEVLQVKGALTPQESEILNENFNALLKLMAKYNV